MKFFKKPKIIPAHFFLSSEESLFDVQSLNILERNCKRIYETPGAFYGFVEDGVLRFRKINARPLILKAEMITIDPSTTSVFMSIDTLFNLAEKYRLLTWELDDRYLVLANGEYWHAMKSDKEGEK